MSSQVTGTKEIHWLLVLLKALILKAGPFKLLPWYNCLFIIANNALYLIKDHPLRAFVICFLGGASHFLNLPQPTSC